MLRTAKLPYICGMEPKIIDLPPKLLVGKKMEMSLIENQTKELIQSFMPLRKHVPHMVNTDVYDLIVYPPNYFVTLNPFRPFVKWAGVEVSQIGELPDGLSFFQIPSGRYAVFTHKGPSSDTGTFEDIFTKWLPNSKHELDDRPHFDIMGEKYKGDQPDSEEEIWIPIQAG